MDEAEQFVLLAREHDRPLLLQERSDSGKQSKNRITVPAVFRKSMLKLIGLMIANREDSGFCPSLSTVSSTWSWRPFAG
jgi:DNA-binding transcriptional regulator/RsmH inhibitor MraZ